MLRHIFMALALAGLAACGDGMGTSYSSQRGQAAAERYSGQGYIPVTPGAVPAAGAGFSTIDPGTAVFTSAAAGAPVAVTPGAVPVTTAALAPGTPAGATLQPAVQVTAPAAEPARVIQASAEVPAVPAAPVVSSGRGPIFSACRSSGRSEATAARCGCIQAVADSRLTAAQQKRGAEYFRDNDKLQEVRQSDRARDEQFWTAWKAFGEAAARQCR